MGVRSTLASLISAPATRLLERELRDLVEDVLASRPVAHAGELEALRAEVAELRRVASAVEAPRIANDPGVATLQTEVERLEKRLSMAMGAVQAGTAQLMQVRQIAEEALAAAKQAGQHATSAKATAESAVDGITGVEDRLDALADQIGTGEPTAVGADEAEAHDESACRVPDCTAKLRARGFCARHYQQFRRSTLDGFVGPDGVLPLGDESVSVGAEHVGKIGRREGVALLLDGQRIR